MSGTKVMTQKPNLTPKSENCRKSTSLPLTAWVDSDNLPREHDRELFESSKDAWSLAVCTEKKNLWDLGLGFSVGVVRKSGGFAFFWLFFHDVITRTMSQKCGSKFGCILGWNMKL